MAGIRILKKYIWTPWLKLPGPCTWLPVHTPHFILSFAWDLQESKDEHIFALYSSAFPTQTKVSSCAAPLNCHILSSLFFFSYAHTRKILISIIKERAKKHRDICFRRLRCHSDRTSDRWMGEETWGCLVLFSSTPIQISCIQMCEGGYRT